MNAALTPTTRDEKLAAIFTLLADKRDLVEQLKDEGRPFAHVTAGIRRMHKELARLGVALPTSK